MIFASTNRQKLKEVRHLTPNFEDLPPYLEEPHETGDTCMENARIKALSYAEQTGKVCLAEDSGIFVDALDGRPGVHAARYSGVTGLGKDKANNAKLLEELGDNVNRSARYVCAVAVARPADYFAQRPLYVYVSSLDETSGQIVRTPRGDNGWAYDCIFETKVGDELLTAAEMTLEQKLNVLPRGKVMRVLLANGIV